MFACKFLDCPNHPDYAADKTIKKDAFKKEIEAALT